MVEKLDLRPLPPPPTPEDAEEIEQIRSRARTERALLWSLAVDALDEAGEVSAPDVRDAFERLCGRSFDKLERLRINRTVRNILVDRTAAGALRLKEIRRTGVESRGPTGLLRNYYERVRAPEREGD